MTKPIGRDTIYRCRRFSAEYIELCVRWYLTYRLSYRDLAAMMAERDVIVSHTTIMRGCCAMRRSTSADGLAFPDLRVGRGVWTKRLCLSVAVGITYFEPWTRTENPLGRCFAMIAIKSPRRHSSEQSSPMDESHGLRKSISMVIKQPFEVWSCLAKKIPAGGKWKCVRGDISTTWLSKTIAPSNSDALRC
jgi:hypothetical protein